MAAIVISTPLDLRIALALTFALAASALISLLLFIVARRRSQKITILPSHARGFKGDAQRAKLSFLSTPTRWLSLRNLSLEMGTGVDVKMQESDKESTEISLIPKYAGRFSDPKIRLELADTFGLFRESRRVSNIDFVLDSLPQSLLIVPRRPAASPLSLGERPTDARGSAQEFYGIDEYRPFADSKDILWKRTSRTQDDELMVKIRASNVPRMVRIGIVELVDRGEDRAEWIDIVCEGISLLANTLMTVGCDVEILYRKQERIAVALVSSYEDLSDSIMAASVGQRSGETTFEIVDKSDIIVTGMRETEDQICATLLLDKPALLVQEGAPLAHVGRHSLVFSGEENIVNLATLVINR